MNRLQEIVDRQSAIRTELLEIEEITEPTEDDAARQDVLLGEFDTLEAERAPLAERAERIEKVRAAAQSETSRESGDSGAGRSTEFMQKRDPFENLDAIRFSYDAKYVTRTTDDMKARAITAVTDYRPYGVSDDAVQSAVRMIESIDGVAEHAIIHGSPAYRSAFEQYLRAGFNNAVYTPEEAEAVRAALSLTGANGGYTLPTLFDPTLIMTGTVSKNPMRQISRVVSGTQNVWHGVSVGNVTSYWTAEATAMTEGSPTFSNPSVTAQKLTAFLSASFEIWEDSSAVSSLPSMINDSFSYMESDAFVVGSGSGAPNGVITAVSGTAASLVTATTRGSIGGVDIFNAIGAVASRYEDNAVWLANKQQYNTIQQLATTTNGALFWTNLNQSTPPQLLGSEIYKSSAMATGTTSGTICYVIGDFNLYLIYDRIGTSVEYVPQLFNSSGIPLGQRGLVAHKRVGGDVLDKNAFRLLKA